MNQTYRCKIRCLIFALTLCLMVSCIALPASAAEISGLDAVTVANGTENASAATITASHSNSTSTTASTKTMTITADSANLGTSVGDLVFDVSYTLNTGAKKAGTQGTAGISATSGISAVSKTGDAWSSNNTHTGTIEDVTIANWKAGSTWSLTMSASAAERWGGYEASSVSVTISNIVFTEYVTESVTFAGIDHDYTVSYYVGDATTASTKTIPANSAGVEIECNLLKTLSVSAPDYRYCKMVQAVRSGATTVLATSDAPFNAKDGDVITPTFVQDWDKDGTAPFLVNNENYWLWEDAVTAANGSGTIVLNEDYTMSAGTYTVPAGVTFLIPNNKEHTVYTSAQNDGDNSYTPPSVYRTLTMANGANIVVNGSISLAGKIGTWMGYIANNVTYDANGAPSGPLGHINMAGGSSITVNSGANLYAWGYILGSGSVEVKSGGKVYEAFQVTDWRGGSVTSDMVGNDQKVFPLTQYYIQNIQVPLKLNAGAKEMVTTGFTITLVGVQAPEIEFIGTNGLFNVGSGSITKDYDEGTDQTVFTTKGDISIANMAITMKTGIIGNITINSKDYVLPIRSGMVINVDSGNVSVSQDMAILPGAEVNIAEGATATMGSGNSLYVYDADNWGRFCYFNGADRTYNPIIYVPTGRVDRSATLSTDGKLRINGTFDAGNGGLYTTTGSANIYSNGSKGKVILGANAATTTYQFSQIADSDDGYGTEAYVPITITSAQLKHGDGSNMATIAGSNTYNYNGARWVCTTHTEETLEGTPATCTTSGLTEGKYCTVCNAVTTEQEEIPALGHTAVSDTNPDGNPIATATPETCITDGVKYDYWQCTREGCGVYYTLAEDGIVTLTAQWADLVRDRYVTFLPEGGEFAEQDPSGYYADGETIIMPEVTREGYRLTGWTDGVNTYAPGEEYTVNNTVNLTAVWEPVETEEGRTGTEGGSGCCCWWCWLLGLFLLIILLWKRRWVKYSLVNGDVKLRYKNGEQEIRIAVVLIDDEDKQHPLVKSGTIRAKRKLRYIRNMGRFPIAPIEPGKYKGKLIIREGENVTVKKCRIKALDKEFKD